MNVKPAAGLLVRDPVNREPLPASGREVPETDYWMRRLRDGDVVKVAPATVAPKKKGE
jgi:hypothetical protein